VEELDELEASLVAGKRIQALFCELPGNPLLITPDLHRIRELADKYNFVVACERQ
jgi:cystathionine gamma-synthase